jgi:hypothetical protein
MQSLFSVCRLHPCVAMQIIPEEVDLTQLVALLRRSFGRHLHASYLRGKTLMRDVLIVEMRCSAFEAEQLVETLELQGYLRFPHLADETHPSDRHSWAIGGQF